MSKFTHSVDFPAILPQVPVSMALFTAETARTMALKAVQAKRDRKQAETLAKAEASAQPEPLPDYLRKRLLRVRKQLDRIDDLLLSEDDPAKLDRLAAASMRLAEQERILAGRPLPGSLKPSAARSRRQPQTYAPIEPDQQSQ